jgi:cytochrome c553
MKLNSLIIATGLLLILPGSLLAAGDIAAGKTKSSSCASCHGANGEGMGENPKIAGMAEKKFSQAIQDYKSGAKKHMMMEMMVKSLSDQDIADLAAFYAKK